jgi:hypothetical protein
LTIGIGLTISPPWVSALRLAGDISLGRNCYSSSAPWAFDTNSRCIRAVGAIGIDLQVPRNNFFYGSFYGLQVREVLNVFAPSVANSLPVWVQEFGFPRTGSLANPELSYAVVQQVIGSRVIPAGVFFRGTLNFFGQMFSVTLRIVPQEQFFLDGRMGPLSIGGGVFVLQRSVNSPSEGPMVLVDVRLQPSLTLFSGTAKLQGYLRIGRILTVSVDVALVENDLHVLVEANVFGFLHGSVEVRGSWRNLAGATFSIRFTLGFSLSDIVNRIIEFLQAMAREADAAIASAQAKVRQAQRDVCATLDKCSSFINEYDACNFRQYQSISECIQCEISRKSEKCKWYTFWKSCWWETLWDTITDVGRCVSSAVRCTATRVYQVVKCIGAYILKKVIDAACKAACLAATAALESANAALSGARNLVRAGSWVAERLMRAAGDAFSVDELSFQRTVSLANMFQMSIDFRFRGRVFGFPINVQVYLSTSSIIDLVKDLFDRAVKSRITAIVG